MSIIHQALKKVQNKLHGASSNNIVTVANTQYPKQHKKIARISALILLPIMTIICLWYFYQQISPALNQTTKIVLPKTPIILPQSPDVKSTPVQPTAPAPSSDIQIQGIVIQGNGRVALINNQIYQTGDAINSRKITAITEDSVIVDDNGQQTTYRLGR